MISEAETKAARELIEDGAELRALKAVIDAWLVKRDWAASQWQGAPRITPYVFDVHSEIVGEYYTYHEMIAAVLARVDA